MFDEAEKARRAELWERYKMAYAEYRAEVNLGTERQKTFISLNPGVAALLAIANRDRVTVSAGLLLAAVASIAGIMLIARSHGRYQNTRNVLLERARELGAEADWQTTGGMREARGEPRWEGPRVTTTLKVLLGLYAVFDVVATALLWR